MPPTQVPPGPPSAGTGQWEESKHPRANDGKFGSGGGSAAAAPTSEAAKPQGDAGSQPSQSLDQAVATISKAFHPDSWNLPHEVRHEHGTQGWEGIVKAATEGKYSFDHALDHGRGVDRVIGGQSVDVKNKQAYQAAMGAPGPVVMIVPNKGQERATEKVDSDYKGDWGRLGDMVRSTVAVDTVAEMGPTIQKTVAHMHSQGWQMVCKPKDRYATPLPGGYRDVMIKMRGPNGMMSELQFNTKEMLAAKEPGHKFYEIERTIDAQAEMENRPYTAEEQRQVTESRAAASKVYGGAWQRLGAAAAQPRARYAMQPQPVQGVEYRHGDGILLRRHGEFGPVEIYRAGGIWERYRNFVRWHTEADVFDEAAANEWISRFEADARTRPQ